MCGCLGDVEDSQRIIEESPMLENLGDQTGRQKFGKFAKAHLRLNLRHPLAYRG